MKKALLDYIANQTSFFDPNNVSDNFSAANIAEKFGIKRNTVSHYLNQLNDEKLVVKINSRPVYFFHKAVFEAQNYPIAKTEYQSLSDIVNEKPIFDEKRDFFSAVIGSKGSLANTIEQIKMAALYPNGGLPILMTGESGSGKSFLMKMFYQFCVANNILDVNAPFVTVNCSQYADNPELLTSHLFGHVKGAFTGAVDTKKGAFEAADGGVLFLDEVHRLSSEGQEKLFTFLDQGIIYPLGESHEAKKITCRLVFATTEEITSTFLTTFLRRIPVQVHLPSFNERTQLEKRQLIYHAFYEEFKNIGIKLIVSPVVFKILENHTYKGNIGELINIIKIATAKSFSKPSSQGAIKISIHSLPNSLLSAAMEDYSLDLEDSIIIDAEHDINLIVEKNKWVYQAITLAYEKILHIYVENDDNIDESEKLISLEIEKMFDYLLFENQREEYHEVMFFITKNVRHMLEKIESSFQINFNGNLVYAISNYLYQRRNIDWFVDDILKRAVIERLLSDVENGYKKSFKYAEQILTLVKNSLDIEISSMDRIILTFYINNLGYTKSSNHPKAIIVAHGYATASSISNVANRLLNESLFQSFDMPLDIKPKKIAESITQYIEKNDTSNGLIILFDMGSLKEIHQYFPKNISTPIVMINNVTTSLAIAVGESIKNDCHFSEIPNVALSYHKNDWEIILPTLNKEKLILTTCSTGLGTAVKIGNLLEKSMPQNLSVKIIPHEFGQLSNIEFFKNSFAIYDVLGIIGTENPNIEDVPFISLEDLIIGKGTEQLLDWIKGSASVDMLDNFNNQLIKNFSLNRVINTVTILDTEKVIKEIEIFLDCLERLWRCRISNDRKIALYVHVSCLIERLIRNMPIENYRVSDKMLYCQEKEVNEIQEAFSVIEKNYSVKIPDSELRYVFDILFQNVDLITKEEDF